MAIFYPALEAVEKLTPVPTEGERHALEVLQGLSDNYEIYFQPFIHGNRPDILVMRKGYGVLIIVVKDWSLEDYHIGDEHQWISSRDNIHVKSPRRQVKAYKDNIYNLHLPSLIEKGIENRRYYGLIKTAVYMHEPIREFTENNDIKKDGYCTIYDKNSFKIKNILNYSAKIKKNALFSVDIYEELKAILSPAFHALEEGDKNIKLSKKQKELSESKARHQKIRGVAGSGKTVLLAQRAVNSHLRHKGKVLILSYNGALKNYILEAISKVSENFHWSNFYVNHYHAFIAVEANNQNIENIDYSNIDLFEQVKDRIVKYKAIFIDEIQDYETEWIRIIKKYFLEENGELVVVGDEKQNVYDKALTERRPNTTIPGAWIVLNESFRLGNNMLFLAEDFQKEFFADKYDFDKAVSNQSDLFSEEISYRQFKDDDTIHDVSEFLVNKINEVGVGSQNICILARTNDLLAEIDYEIRNSSTYATSTTFENQEWNRGRKIESWRIRNIRKSRRQNFKIHFEGINLSTIYSFKGWEIDTLFLIIDESGSEIDELIYTAITRCKGRLFVLNIGNERYNQFFSRNIKAVGAERKLKADESIVVKEQLEKAREIEQPENTEQEEQARRQKTTEQKKISQVKLEASERNNEQQDIVYSLTALAKGNKFQVLILGEISEKKHISKLEISLQDHFSTYNTEEEIVWNVEHWDNNKLKNKGVKTLRKPNTKYSLLITGQIHNHSIRGIQKANVLEELSDRNKYPEMIEGSKPQRLLSKNDFNSLPSRIDSHFRKYAQSCRHAQ